MLKLLTMTTLAYAFIDIRDSYSTCVDEIDAGNYICGESNEYYPVG